MRQLDLTITGARNFPPHRYYVKAYILIDGWRAIKIKTGRSTKTATPQWNQRFRVAIKKPLVSSLQVDLYLDPRWGCDRHIDTIWIPLNQLTWKVPLNGWCDIGSGQIHLSLTAMDFGIGHKPDPDTTTSGSIFRPHVIYVSETQNQRDTGDMLMAGGLGFFSGLLLGELI